MTYPLNWLGAARTLLILAILAASAFAPAHAAETRFTREFAPQDGLTAPVERPYRDEICLNGSWRFQPMRASKGQSVLPLPTVSGWEKTLVRIPSPWNVNAFPDQSGQGGDFRCFPSYPPAWNAVEAGWLHRSFLVPSAWRGQRLILHFAAVAGETQVVVNGASVAHHFDIFLPFEIDITASVRYGKRNDLLVGIRKASLFDVPGRYGRRPYQGGSMWGQAIVGIWQDVFLKRVPAVHVSDVFVKPNVSGNELAAEVTVRNDAGHSATVHLTGDVHCWINRAGPGMISAPEPKWTLDKRSVLQTDVKRVVVPAHGFATVHLTASRVDRRLKHWSPTAPNLYGLVCRVSDEKGTVHDAKYMRFGWRQITFQGAKVLLNGAPIVMKGDSWHFMGIPEMTRRYAWAWFKALKDAHLNAVRLHAQPYPSFFLDVADEQGVLVLDEDAVWASDGGPKVDDPSYWQDTETHLAGLILRDRNHPAVFGWSVSNEVMAVVRNVFHAPQEIQDRVNRSYGIWAGICRKFDPTRVWISADGEDDGGGALPTYMIHYGDRGTMERAAATGKPWGVGEAGPAYYGTPEQVAKQSGDPRAYLSFEDRMEGVADVSYRSLSDQVNTKANYRSVFNLVWYGLKPLELGMRDTTRPPALSDGVFFPAFVEGKPGVQPERLGPYCTTLNPGYDPRLPLYSTWPLFDAIRDAQAEPPIPYKPAHPFAFNAGRVTAASEATSKVVRVLSGPGGTLAQALTDMGATVVETGADSSPLFVDGAQPPEAEAKTVIGRTLDAGGAVFVWGADPSTLARLNELLPYPLELTGRTASSLITVGGDPIVAGLMPGTLYFSELNPSTILPAGLGGPLLDRAKPLLIACNTDWKLWNGQPETSKTVMVLRSEREAKPAGAALAALWVGKGRLFVCNIPARPQTSQALMLNRTLLANLGIALTESASEQNLFDPNGNLRGALVCGSFSAASVEDAMAANYVPPGSGRDIAAGKSIEGRPWKPLTANIAGEFALPDRNVPVEQKAVAYLSFWIYSPKSLDNLLLDPHLPNLSLTLGSMPAGQVWLNGSAMKTSSFNGVLTASPLSLQQGWNHLLIKTVRSAGGAVPGPSIRLVSSLPAFLTQLRGAREKP